jgi:hypothetical protein
MTNSVFEKLVQLPVDALQLIAGVFDLAFEHRDPLAVVLDRAHRRASGAEDDGADQANQPPGELAVRTITVCLKRHGERVCGTGRGVPKRR